MPTKVAFWMKIVNKDVVISYLTLIDRDLGQFWTSKYRKKHLLLNVEVLTNSSQINFLFLA